MTESTSFVLRGVRALDAGGGFTGPLDLVVRDGVIATVGPRGRRPRGGAELDADGLWLMPGVVDCHPSSSRPPRRGAATRAVNVAPGG